ncbi:MAG: SCO family protein [Gammaproteobacteria bacterium]|nr:SCO family protein [Gammaproteobacteria bacterium]
MWRGAHQLLFLLAVAVPAVAAGASSEARAMRTQDGFDRTQALAVSQAALGRSLGNHALVAADGTRVTLDRFSGKPLVVSMIFTSCAHICPATTQNLRKGVAEARRNFGTDSFNVVTIGFDAPRDTPDAMREFARRQGVSDPGWYFLAADQPTIDALARELGFIYFPSGGGFDHLIQSTIVDGKGVIYRQVYGIDFALAHLLEPLKELVYSLEPEQSLYQSLTNRIRLFCTVYDPASDSYRFSYAIFVGLIIGLMLGAVAVYLLAREWAQHRRHNLLAARRGDA